VKGIYVRATHKGYIRKRKFGWMTGRTLFSQKENGNRQLYKFMKLK